MAPLRGAFAALHAASQLFAIEGRELRAEFPEPGPGGVRLADGPGILARHIQGAALALVAESQIQVGSVAAGGIVLAGAAGLAAAAGSFRQPALDHGLGGGEELLEEFYPTHLYMIG